MNSKKLNKKYYGSVWNIVFEILRYCIVCLTNIILDIICIAIIAVTYEPNSKGRLTIRKAKRIRKLTKLKLWFYREFPKLSEFLDMDGYLKTISEKF